MDETMKQFQQRLTKLETEAEHLLLARHQLVENDKERNGNREALTALRKRAQTTKTSVPSPFESIMKDIVGTRSRPLVKEVCATCGNHDSNELMWMMFPGSDIFTRAPFHAVHTILEADQARLNYNENKLQSYVKEKSFSISEIGALADKISPAVLRSLVMLTDKAKELRQCASSTSTMKAYVNNMWTVIYTPSNLNLEKKEQLSFLPPMLSMKCDKCQRRPDLGTSLIYTFIRNMEASQRLFK